MVGGELNKKIIVAALATGLALAGSQSAVTASIGVALLLLLAVDRTRNWAVLASLPYALTFTPNNPLLLGGLIVYFLLFLHLKVREPGEATWVLGQKTVFLIGTTGLLYLLTPLYPDMWSKLTLFLIVTTLSWLHKYIMIRGAIVDELYFDKIVEYGKPVTVKALVSSPINIHVELSVEIDGRIYASMGKGRSLTLNVSFPYNRYGRHLFASHIRVTDEYGLASKIIYSVRNSFTVRPSFRSLLDTFRRRLAVAARYYGVRSVNVMVAGILSAGRTGRGGRGSKGEGRGMGEKGVGGEGIARMLIEYLERTRGITRYGKGYSSVEEGGANVRAELYGVKNYSPGDNPRDIHWKKSISKGFLVSKIYVGGLESAGEGSGSASMVIVFDSFFPSMREFDESIKNLLYIAHLNALEKGFTSRIILVIIENREIYFFEGRLLDIFAGFSNVVERVAKNLKYDFRPSFYTMTSHIREGGNSVGLVYTVNKRIAEWLADEFEEKNLRRDVPIYMIYGKNRATRYDIVRKTLSERGYRVIA